MPSTTRELAQRYREQMNCLLLEPAKSKDRQEEIGNPYAGRKARKAYWRAHMKVRNRIFPRGRNFVLMFEGMI